jgi:hypothetical protein
VLTTNQKGAIAEMAIAHEAAQLGIGVSKPLWDLRYDLIFDTGRHLLRVQCKWASRCGNVIVLRMYGARRGRTGLLRSFYGPEEVDAFAAYCRATGRCYFTTIAEMTGRSQLQLRLDPTRNNQLAGVNWAKDYEFAAKLTPVLGP